MVAKVNTLGELHVILATTMGEALDAERHRIALTEELMNVTTEELTEETLCKLSDVLALAPTARVDNALLKTISAFLKDNSITADLESGDDIDEKARKLSELADKRRKVALPTDTIN